MLPVFYIAVSVAMTSLTKRVMLPAAALLLIGLAANIFWNPPYPFPYENNYAMVDFVRLQQIAASFAERHLGDRTIATAWPYTAALEQPDYGFVTRKLNVIETNDFHPASIQAIPAARFGALITYTRTWAPENGVISLDIVRRFLRNFYQWESPITTEECLSLGLHPVISWSARGQTIAVYTRGNN